MAAGMCGWHGCLHVWMAWLFNHINNIIRGCPQVSDPLALLQELLGRSDDVVEARLVASAGSGTLEAVYTVALYRRDRSYLAAGAGESVEVAVQEAAAVALDALFGDTASRPALPFRRAAPRVRHSLPAAPLPPTTAAAPLAPLSDWTLDRADARLANVVLCE
ncbi:uncharacterized protein LOC108677887 [Hyalella azteca]|uniref:Uncharacterized protein LOC108677887 n=1 Tax=Hyalella azteca TaxID=294128 RepID=A0A8B7P736_HYAAZ|nr:uncharacterized protein LOC108677887 [Hyalella azteca]